MEIKIRTILRYSRAIDVYDRFNSFRSRFPLVYLIVTSVPATGVGPSSPSA
ncbi:MAG: hypothetical protein O3B95_12610 [Chloroflexi bacterium]|nr:hypothetical protein [Chloroflexota bacterium]